MAPVLFIAGDRDRVTPPAMTRSLYQHSTSPEKTLVIVRGGGHGDLVRFHAFWQAMAEFLARVYARPP